MNTNAEAVRQFYAALNRNDLPAMVAQMDPDIVRVEFEGLPAAGTYRGIAGVEAHIAKGRGTWAEGTCEPEQIFERGDKVVAYVHVRVRLQEPAQWVEGRLADGFVFRAGRMIEFRTFPQRAEADAWAGS